MSGGFSPKRVCWYRRFGGTPPDWFVRLGSRPVTPAVDSRFRRWLSAEEANERAYERQELTWELAGELQDDPEIAAMLAEAEQTSAAVRPRSFRHEWTWSAIAASAAAVVIGVYLTSLYGGQLHTTGVGEQRTIVLPDRSRISLNTDTRVRVFYRETARIVHLEQGEATFSVSRDSARPFEVHAERGIARALGTEFNVLSSASSVTVSVLSGRVGVLAPPERSATGTQTPSTLLRDGEEVTYTASTLSRVEAAKVARIRAWHAGRITFEDLTLEDALAEFNRYNVVPISMGDGSLAALRVTGAFRVGETDAFLRALERAFDIRAQRGEGAIVLWAGDESPGESG